MRRLVQRLARIAMAVWSLVARDSYGVLELFGAFAARSAGLVTDHPEGVEWLS